MDAAKHGSLPGPGVPLDERHLVQGGEHQPGGLLLAGGQFTMRKLFPEVLKLLTKRKKRQKLK